MAFSTKARATITAITRAINNTHPSPLLFRNTLHCTRFSTHTFSSIHPSLKASIFNSIRTFTSQPNKTLDTKINFSLSDSESDTDDENSVTPTPTPSKLPPPYDPFSKKPAIEEPKDPKDLQEIFHNMRSGDGMLNHAVKMFDALSKEGLTHEALELFAQIKDKGKMPDVVAHTAILEAYANAGQPKEALKVYMRMLASGVAPNVYTYAVLIKGLACDAKFLRDAKKFVLEMIEKGMKPNAGTYTAVFEGLVREERIDEAEELLEKMKDKGFVPDEKAVREVLSSQRGPVFRTVINILFGK